MYSGRTPASDKVDKPLIVIQLLRPRPEELITLHQAPHPVWHQRLNGLSFLNDLIDGTDGTVTLFLLCTVTNTTTSSRLLIDSLKDTMLVLAQQFLLWTQNPQRKKPHTALRRWFQL